MPNDIDALRSHLFDTLAALKDKDHPMELDRAKAVADVARVLVESAKVEVDFLKVTGAGSNGTGFLPAGDARPRAGQARLNGNRPPPTPKLLDGDRCVLCECRLTTQYAIERGLCGSCSDRPEAKNIPARVAGATR